MMDNEDLLQIEGILCRFTENIKKEFAHQQGIQREDIQKQLAMIGEGHQMLAEKISQIDARLTRRVDDLEQKLDAVAAPKVSGSGL